MSNTDWFPIVSQLVPEQDGEGATALHTATVTADNGDGTVDVQWSGGTITAAVAASSVAMVGSVVHLLLSPQRALVIGTSAPAVQNVGPFLIERKDMQVGAQGQVVRWNPDDYPPMSRWDYIIQGTPTAGGTFRMRFGANNSTYNDANYRWAFAILHGNNNTQYGGGANETLMNIGQIRNQMFYSTGTVYQWQNTNYTRTYVNGQTTSGAGVSSANHEVSTYGGGLYGVPMGPGGEANRLDQLVWYAPAGETWTSGEMIVYGYAA